MHHAPEPHRQPLAPLLWLLAAVCLGQALRIYDGTRPDPLALRWVAMTLLLAGLATWGRLTVAWRSLPQWTAGLALAAVVVQLAQWLTLPLGKHWLYPRQNMGTLHLLVLAAVAFAALTLAGPKRRTLAGAGFLAALLLAGLWFVRWDGRPEIDVFEFQQQGCAALAGGHNPYAMTFASPYPDDTPFYSPGLVVGGRLQFGYIYPPLLLGLQCPVALATGDVRFAHWLALVAAGVLAWRTARNHLTLLAIAVLLTTPRTLFLIEQAWTEPFVILGLAAVLWSAVRKPAWLPWIFGAFLGTKQYLVLVAPLGLLLDRELWKPKAALAFFGRAALVLLALHLPAVAADPQAFWRSVVTLQMLQPFRPDSLSWLAAWSTDGKPPVGVWIAFVLALGAVAVNLWRAPRTPAGFAAAVATVLLAFLALNKQAFWNYYHFPLAALAMAAAVAPGDEAQA
ncbi:MAG: hypothetical protein HY902_13260 [Deltaproteobacteria bacterium]|nr:hypothetical protein [Deltaproteobacteria bacterium]